MSSLSSSQPPADTQQDTSEFSTSKRMKTDNNTAADTTADAITSTGATKESNIDVKSEAVLPLSIAKDEDMKMKGSDINEDGIQIKLGPTKGDVCSLFFFPHHQFYH